MTRLLLILAAPAALVMVAPAAPVPTHLMPKEESPYFPTTVGTKWVYLDDGAEQTVEVTRVKQEDAVAAVTIRRKFADGFETERQVGVSPDGLFLPSPARPAEERLLLPLPHRDGQRWVAFLGVCRSGRTSLTARGPETVTVPAGKFAAIRVEMSFAERMWFLDHLYDEGAAVTAWYARGVGPVKVVGGDHVCVLKSFTLGKK